MDPWCFACAAENEEPNPEPEGKLKVLPQTNPHSLGALHNIERMLGHRPIFWVLPYVHYNRSGFEFDQIPVPNDIDIEPKIPLSQINEEEDSESAKAEMATKDLYYEDLMALNQIAPIEQRA